MKLRVSFLTIALVSFFAIDAPAAVLYVEVNSANATAPYTDWVTAAIKIQDAVDVASPGDQILVGAGLYQESVQLGTNTVQLVSASGPAFTFIMAPPGAPAVGFGGQHGSANVDALLSGFTVTNSTCGVYVSGASSPTIISNTA
ncbi:MAG: hypothetical protein ABSH20_30835 [Tepidisphaeraceae bacterium]|jgi:parallel beta-helix repeat protein